MLTPEQEQKIESNIAEAKRLLLEAITMVKQNLDATFEQKDMDNDNGSAWLALAGEITNGITDLEKVLEYDMRVAASFEKRLAEL